MGPAQKRYDRFVDRPTMNDVVADVVEIVKDGQLVIGDQHGVLLEPAPRLESALVPGRSG